MHHKLTKTLVDVISKLRRELVGYRAHVSCCAFIIRTRFLCLSGFQSFAVISTVNHAHPQVSPSRQHQITRYRHNARDVLSPGHQIARGTDSASAQSWTSV